MAVDQANSAPLNRGRSMTTLWLGVAVIGGAVLYADVLRWLWNTWSSNSDYSHGFFVPPFFAYLVWANRKALQSEQPASPRMTAVVAVGLLGLALGLRLLGMYTRVLSLEGLSLLPFVLGISAVVVGPHAVRLLLPATCFLLFMLPLPGFLAGGLSGALQAIATKVSTFSIQVLGIPAFSEGNIIMLTNGQIGVAEACSGIRMLYTFFALTVATCMVTDRSLVERMIIGVSAIPIAVAVNCLRITVTALAYEYLSAETAQHIFHDVAGWLMMPVGLGFLMLGLVILEKIIVPAEPALAGARR